MGKTHYYLKHLAPDVRLYTFVESTKKLYKYTPKGVEIAEFEDLKKTMELFQKSIEVNIESLFQANNYLISPLNTPDKFMEGDYFLTNQQHDIKKKIVDMILLNDNKEYILGITGKAGTGKCKYFLAKDLNGAGAKKLKRYQYIFVDEAQRIYFPTFEKIIKEAVDESKAVVFAYDYVQALSKAFRS